MFCKDTYITAKIQRVGNPERPYAKVSRNSRKTFAEEKKLAWVLGSGSKRDVWFQDILLIDLNVDSGGCHQDGGQETDERLGHVESGQAGGQTNFN